MDGIEAIAGNIFAQLLEIAALSHLANGLRAAMACSQEKRGALFAFGFQIGINPDFHGAGIAAANIPKTEG